MDTLIERTLQHRADVAPLHEASPATVQRRAAQVRGRRRAAATSLIAGVAVVVAVAATVGVGSELGRGHHAPQPAAPTPTQAPRVVELGSLTDLAQGDRPAIGYGYGLRLHLADGTTRPVPGKKAYESWTTFAGGFLVASSDLSALTRYAGDGTPEARYTPGAPPAVSTDGRRAAWVDDGGHVDIARGFADGGMQVTRRAVPDVTGVVGFLPDGGVAVAGRGRGRVVDGGDRVRRLPALVSPNATSEAGALVAGQTARGDYAVVSSATDRVLWRSRLLVTGFSSDGRYALGLADGSAPRTLALLDARTGGVVRTLQLPRHTRIYAPRWEDAAHVLAIVVDSRGQRQALVRFGVDGSLARATAVTSSEEHVYILQKTP
ncbi:hypothetical protein D9V37_01630 [Nocardioides mangrovicus]|uniref:WD40 repeat domain-containing protein n=1 Tax=Nocardioides mangrovicus TaxID=2478913 RepID=A0A3L8P6H8_9ACTN|nr:hypothetical protein [Nocardioides mangrovicus]RLV50694.1 hypothetical protein D9V37_01630 [Nocardioides mangrovicus]